MGETLLLTDNRSWKEHCKSQGLFEESLTLWLLQEQAALEKATESSTENPLTITLTHDYKEPVTGNNLLHEVLKNGDNTLLHYLLGTTRLQGKQFANTHINFELLQSENNANETPLDIALHKRNKEAIGLLCGTKPYYNLNFADKENVGFLLDSIGEENRGRYVYLLLTDTRSPDLIEAILDWDSKQKTHYVDMKRDHEYIIKNILWESVLSLYLYAEATGEQDSWNRNNHFARAVEYWNTKSTENPDGNDAKAVGTLIKKKLETDLPIASLFPDTYRLSHYYRAETHSNWRFGDAEGNLTARVIQQWDASNPAKLKAELIRLYHKDGTSVTIHASINDGKAEYPGNVKTFITSFSNGENPDFTDLAKEYKDMFSSVNTEIEQIKNGTFTKELTKGTETLNSCEVLAKATLCFNPSYSKEMLEFYTSIWHDNPLHRPIMELMANRILNGQHFAIVSIDGDSSELGKDQSKNSNGYCGENLVALTVNRFDFRSDTDWLNRQKATFLHESFHYAHMHQLHFKAPDASYNKEIENLGKALHNHKDNLDAHRELHPEDSSMTELPHELDIIYTRLRRFTLRTNENPTGYLKEDNIIEIPAFLLTVPETNKTFRENARKILPETCKFIDTVSIYAQRYNDRYRNKRLDNSFLITPPEKLEISKNTDNDSNDTKKEETSLSASTQKAVEAIVDAITMKNNSYRRTPFNLPDKHFATFGTSRKAETKLEELRKNLTEHLENTAKNSEEFCQHITTAFEEGNIKTLSPIIKEEYESLIITEVLYTKLIRNLESNINLMAYVAQSIVTKGRAPFLEPYEHISISTSQTKWQNYIAMSHAKQNDPIQRSDL